MVVKMILLLLAGLVAGVFNVMAGGGSLLTLPALIFLGLPPVVANGTNRIALLFQNAAGIVAFQKKGHFYPRLTLLLAIPSALGSLVGSWFAVELADEHFRLILSAVMLGVIVMMLFSPHQRISRPSEGPLGRGRSIALVFIFLLIGAYGGFIQVGVGFLIIIALCWLTPYSLVVINSVKVALVLVFTVPAFVMFFMHGKMDYTAGLVLSVGNAVGAWLGTHFAVRSGDKVLRAFFLITSAALALKVAGLFDWLAALMGLKL
jgi:uncharacterized membrane protein YfcA